MASSTRRKIARSAVRRVKRAKKTTYSRHSRKQAHKVRTGKYSTSNTKKIGGGWFDLKWNLSLTINGQTPVTLNNALDIKLSKNFTGNKYTLKIEIDIHKYRYKILPLVNTIIQKLFNDDTLIVYDISQYYKYPIDFDTKDFNDIATYNRTKIYNTQNETIKYKNGYSCYEQGYEDPLMKEDGKPKNNCIIEIEIEPTQSESTIIRLKKYTSIKSKGTTCVPPNDYHKFIYELGKIVQTEPQNVSTTVQKTISDFNIFKTPGTIDVSYTTHS